MGATTLRLALVLLLSCAASASAAEKSNVGAHVQEPAPRMGSLAQPHASAVYQLRIELPHGRPLCGMVESFSSMEWFYVPVDSSTRCEQLGLPMDWEQWPDFVVIGPYLDTPMTLDGLDDYVRQETFFCAGKNTGIGGGLPRPSDATTSIEPAENALLGLRTVTCMRSDQKLDRYSKAFLSYTPMPSDSGRGYMVATYAHLKNRRAADRLLEDIVERLKLLN